MDRLITLGRWVFALALAGFGVQHYIFVSSPASSLRVGPPWILGSAFDMCVVGGLLVVAAIGIAIAREVFLPAAFFGCALFLYDVILYGPRFAANIRDPDPWTSANELLVMCGAAFILSGSNGRLLRSRPWSAAQDKLVTFGRFCFAFPFAVFGVQHFIYVRYNASLIPGWLPFHYFWAYLVGVAYIAASIGIAVRVRARLAAILLGVLFFLIVLLVHTARVFRAPHSGEEWSNLLVPLAICGCSLLATQPCLERSTALQTLSTARADVTERLHARSRQRL